MTNFAYTQGIPETNDNPSDDQPPMKINNDSNFAIWNEDHRGFELNDGGTHLQQRYLNFSAGAVLIGIPASTAYPNAGIADATRAQYYFRNSNANYPLSALKAFGVFNSGVAGALPLLNGFNVASIIQSSGPGTRFTYTITLVANTTATDDVAIFVLSSGVTVGPASIINSTNLAWSFASNVLTIISQQIAPLNISFQILQI